MDFLDSQDETLVFLLRLFPTHPRCPLHPPLLFDFLMTANVMQTNPLLEPEPGYSQLG